MNSVLVVEDSRAMQRTLQRLFESDGLQVQIAPDGVEGLDTFKKRTPTVVVLDLKLPRLPGKELCRALKTHEPTVPVVVLSANRLPLPPTPFVSAVIRDTRLSAEAHSDSKASQASTFWPYAVVPPIRIDGPAASRCVLPVPPTRISRPAPPSM